MRAFTIATLSALAATSHAAQLPLFTGKGRQALESAQQVFNDVLTGTESFLGDKLDSSGGKRYRKPHVEKWVGNDGRTYVKHTSATAFDAPKAPGFTDNDEGVVYELVTHPAFPEHAVRLREPKLCDPTVKQYSGYLDISEDKHLFFWFFESRTKPKSAPLTLWLNGGPGCSSSTGLLFELGPCRISDEGNGTVPNEHSWNSHSNMIFLDQPVTVGYSYTDGPEVNNTPDAADDVYAFLELFLGRFKEYSKLPFHIAAESYGGRYAPLIASAVHKQNKALALAPTPVPGVVHINLASVLIGNGQTEPFTQFGSMADYACRGPYAVFDGDESPQCISLESKIPTCQRLIQSCYNFGSRLSCVPAALYCNSQMYGSFMQLGLNPYDVRKKCDRSKDGDLCYKEMGWIETYLNNPEIKKELGGADVEFKSCNIPLNQAFLFQGDGMRNSAEVIPELLQDGIRVLIYAGMADFMCNFIGNANWMLKLENKFQKEFNAAPLVDFRTLEGKVAGKVRAAGGEKFSAGNFTFVQIDAAGHMVPFDQPEAALDLFVRWIHDSSLTLTPGDFEDALVPN